SSLWMTHKPKGYHDPAWRRRPGGGPILINAIHEVDSLRMLLGNIAEVQAFSSNAVRGFEVEDTTAAVFRFSSGALGTLTLSDTASAPWTWEWTSGENPDFPKTNADSLFIAGTLGSLAVPSLCLRTHLKGAESWLTPLLEDKLPYQAQDPYIPQMTNFADVIRGDAEPVVSGREGLKTLAATLAIAEAANTGRAVKL
ncbi:MAG: Gfo/Idh/MocA family protein, partial [Alphaproteobacteria bacterium]